MKFRWSSRDGTAWSPSRSSRWIPALLLGLLVGACGSCGTSSTAASGSGVDVVLRWSAPTTNADGSPLADLAGYRIYYDTLPIDPSRSRITSTGTETSDTLRGLGRGSYHFAVTAVDTSGNESAMSNEVIQVIP